MYKNVEAFTVLGPGDLNGSTLYGSLAEHKARLSVLNRQLGYNVFFTVQPTDGQGRKAENIRQARCVFGDYDNGLPKEWALEPTLLVESSPGRFQAYWNFDTWTSDLARWGRIQRSLVERTCADKQAQDIARIFRVPGFINHKRHDNWEVRVKAFSSKVYDADTLSEAFGEAEPAWMAAGGQGVTTPSDLPPVERREERYRSWLESQRWPAVGERNATLFRWAANGVRDFALDGDMVATLLEDIWEQRDTTGAFPDMEQFVRNASRSASRVVGAAFVKPVFTLVD